MNAAIQKKLVHNDRDIKCFWVKLNDDTRDRGEISKIPTDFAISKDQDDAIKRATAYLFLRKLDGKSVVDELADAILKED